MTMIIFVVVWWLAGMSGALLLWRDWKIEFPDQHGRCPTRAGALVIFCAGLGGPLLLFVGSAVTLISWADRRPRNPDSWWHRPIC